MRAAILFLLLWPGAIFAQQLREQLALAKERALMGDRCAYLYFTAIPLGTKEREEADKLLDQAEEEYSRGLERLEAALKDAQSRGAFQAANQDFAKGRKLAPMRPRILFELGDVYFNGHNYERAAYFYWRAALFSPENRDDLESFCQEEQDTPLPEDVVTAPSPTQRSWWPLYLAAVLGVVGLALGRSYWRSRRGEGITLEAFAQKVPEAGPEIAREISCIRHELIKHRLGLAPALTNANEKEGVREFVLARLGGDLEGDFTRHVESLQRIASGRLESAWNDPILRPLARAVKHAARTSRKLAVSGDPKQASRDLEAVREDLLTADRALARLVSALGQTTLDAAFLREAVASVRKEPRIQSLPLDAINYAEVTPAPQVAIPKLDLSIVVKNLVRNALLALQGAKGRRMLSLEVTLELELTGEESVLLQIKDSAPGVPELEHTPAGRGLWIVQKTLGRYDGALSALREPEGSAFTKMLVVRLFRAM